MTSTIKGTFRYVAAACLLCAACAAAAQEPAGAGPPAEKQRLGDMEQRKLDYFFYEGINLKNSGKYDASFDMFKRCLEIDSSSSAAMFELASYYIEMNKPEKAVALMKKALAYAPGNQEYRKMSASLLFSVGMFGEAADEYETLIAAYPDKPELNYYLAEAYNRMGEIGKAIETLDALESGLGMHEAISIEKFQLYMALKEPEKASNELKKLSDKFPLEPRYPIMAGDFYLQRGDTAQALACYTKAREIDPESPYYPISMANYYEKAGLRDSAKQQIHEALVNERLDIGTKAGILARYIQQLRQTRQEIDGANALFQTLLEQHPHDSQLKLMYSSFLALQGKNEEAKFQCQIVTESEPDNLDAWQQMLRLSLQMGDLDEMVRICKKCQEIFPDNPEFYFNLGITYFQQKKYQEAIDAYKSGLAAIPDDNKPLASNFYGQIGDAYFQMKDTEKAFEAYEEALKFNGENVVVLNNYAYYLSLLKKDLAKAERMSALCIKFEPDNATYIDTYAWIFFVQGNYTLAKIYIEQALSNDLAKSPELVDHYGDILFMSGEKEKAVEQWKKAKEMGKNSPTLDKKIADGTYYEATEEEKIDGTETSE